MTILHRLINFLKKKKYLVLFIVIILAGAGFLVFKNGKNGTAVITIERTDFVNQVSVSGKVVAGEAVDLSFEKSGILKNIIFSVGQTVGQGMLIARLDASDAEQDVRDAEIALASARLDWEKIKLNNSELSLNSDLLKAYDDGFTATQDTFLDFLPIKNGLDDLLSEYALSVNSVRSSGQVALDYREKAEKLYYQAKDSYETNEKIFRTLDRSASPSQVEDILNKTYNTTKIFSDAVKSMKSFVDFIAYDTGREEDYVDYQNTLSQYASTVSEHASDLLSSKIGIADNKDAFSDTDLSLADAELSIRQKENALLNARSNLEDYYIRAPFSGIVTNIEAKIGEVVLANSEVISMISTGVFEIESFIPEISISQIKVGDEAKITLDAYGDQVLFFAKIISIDPAETLKDGVSTYKTRLQFMKEDERIKPGMTANVSITTFSKPNTIVVPGGVIIEKNGRKIVQLKTDDGISEREIVAGNISSLGQVEILDGLSEGDKVILNPEIK